MPGGTFRQLGGIYYDKALGGVKRTKGAIVKSDKDLDVLFAGMFERLEGKTRRGRDEVITPMPTNTLPPTVAAKMMNKNVTGSVTVKKDKIKAGPEDEEVDTDEEVIVTGTEEEVPQDDEDVEAPTDTPDEEEVEEEEEPVEEVEEEPEPEPEPPKKRTPAKKTTKKK